MIATRGLVSGRALGTGVLAVILLLCLMTPVVGAQSSDAQLRVAHAAPDATAVDLYIDGARVVSNGAFGAVSPYQRRPAGSVEVKVLPAGAAPTTPSLLTATITLSPGQIYTIAITGRANDLRATTLTDDLTPPAAGQARVRLIHGSPNAPAVDIAVADGPVLFRDISFRSASPYVAVPAGAYNLEVRPAGQSVVALPVPGVRVEAGNVYTVFGLGLLQGEPTFRAQVVLDATATGALPRAGAGGMAAASHPLDLAAAALGLGLLALTVWRRWVLHRRRVFTVHRA